jgi:hypothetical protein
MSKTLQQELDEYVKTLADIRKLYAEDGSIDPDEQFVLYSLESRIQQLRSSLDSRQARKQNGQPLAAAGSGAQRNTAAAAPSFSKAAWEDESESGEWAQVESTYRGNLANYEARLDTALRENPPDSATKAKEWHGKLFVAHGSMRAAEYDGRFALASQHLDELVEALENYEEALAGYQKAQNQAGAPSIGKAGVEVELFTREITKKINYGEFKLGATIKIPPSAGGGTVNVVGTSKEKDGKRVQGAKFGMYVQEIKDLNILQGLDIVDPEIGLEGEWSGTEISNYANFKFTIVTSYFNAPASLRIILFEMKGDDSIRMPGIQLKVSPTNFTVKIKGVETKLQAEYKASFAMNWQAVGKEILEKLAKDKLKKEAEKQGVKMLARKAGEKVLTRLGPLATAFGVGWDAGTFLRQYTAAGDAAQYVIEDIMGDFAEQWHAADTIGKMKLIVKNRVRIVAALVAGGVIGTAAGIGDVVLFKVMGLDKLKDFGTALEEFMNLIEKIPKPTDAVANMQTAAAIKLGIKFNPKYHTISDPSLSTLTRATYDKIKPIYSPTDPDASNKLVNMHLHDIDVDQSVHQKIAVLIQQKQLTYTGLNPKSSTTEISDNFLDFILSQYLGFLESNRLISYKVKISGDDLGTDSITQDLIDELFL